MCDGDDEGTNSSILTCQFYNANSVILSQRKFDVIFREGYDVSMVIYIGNKNVN